MVEKTKHCKPFRFQPRIVIDRVYWSGLLPKPNGVVASAGLGYVRSTSLADAVKKYLGWLDRLGYKQAKVG